MPLYDYVCPECGHKETAMRRVAERDNLLLVPRCPRWHEGEDASDWDVPMERVKVAAPGFVLKGKGWAKDGYKG